ncbi:MAG: cell division protein SepF, partial [Armatimonadetes bacterium]|nr:cell division protein SepF [Armatimonadota bacterium]
MSAMERLMTFLGFSEEPEEDGAESPEAAPARRSPVFSLHAQRQWEIVVLETQSLEDARRGADFVKSRRPVVVNLRGVEVDQA